VELYLHSP